MLYMCEFNIQSTLGDNVASLLRNEFAPVACSHINRIIFQHLDQQSTRPIRINDLYSCSTNPSQPRTYLIELNDMTRSHAKNAHSSPVFTYHERSQLPYGSKKLRLGAESFRAFDACSLCNSTLRDPCACPDGHLYCRVRQPCSPQPQSLVLPPLIFIISCGPSTRHQLWLLAPRRIT